MSLTAIDRHIFQTYRTLRLGIGVLALSFPIALISLGLIYEVDGIGNSWSAYYHHSPVTRDVFVGVLWALGTFFILYKGYSKRENYALNIAGFFAICVAMNPMNLYDADVRGVTNPCTDSQIEASHTGDHEHDFLKDKDVMAGKKPGKLASCYTSAHVHVPGTDKFVISLHGLSAAIFFFSAAFVAYFTSAATLPKLGNPPLEVFLKNFYRSSGALMIIIPVVLIIADAIKQGSESTLTFWIETAGLLAFISYWVVKTFELMYVSDDLILEDRELLASMGVQSDS